MVKKRYRVRMSETAVYDVEVEADNEDDAEEAAEEAFVQADDINKFFQFVTEREVDHVEELD